MNNRKRPRSESTVKRGKCDYRFPTGRHCTTLATHQKEQRRWCTAHAPSDAERIPAAASPPREPHEEPILVRHQREVEALVRARPEPRPGCIQVVPRRAREHPPLKKGWLTVLPHFHTSGPIAYPSLSPHLLGPVEHGQPGLPPARTISNYVLFNQVWPSEMDGRTALPTLAWHDTRRAGYESPEQRWFKYDPTRLAQEYDALARRHEYPLPAFDPFTAQPAFTVHCTRRGTQCNYNAIQSRYFFCRAYEVLVRREPAYQELCQRLRDGFDLLISGYNIPEVPPGLDYLQLYEEYYLNPNRAFGHELVLYTMLYADLRGETDASRFPWNYYVEEHPELYNDCGPF